MKWRGRGRQVGRIQKGETEGKKFHWGLRIAVNIERKRKMNNDWKKGSRRRRWKGQFREGRREIGKKMENEKLRMWGIKMVGKGNLGGLGK